jgi:hypothetical protein
MDSTGGAKRHRGGLPRARADTDLPQRRLAPRVRQLAQNPAGRLHFREQARGWRRTGQNAMGPSAPTQPARSSTNDSMSHT